MPYEIILTPDALDHLAALTARERRLVLDAIEKQLAYEPVRITRQRKPLRPNPLASWELRVEHFRVYYQVETDEDERNLVYVVAVGSKTATG